MSNCKHTGCSAPQGECSGACLTQRRAVPQPHAVPKVTEREALEFEWSWYDDRNGRLTSEMGPPIFGGMQEGEKVTLYTSSPRHEILEAQAVAIYEAALRCTGHVTGVQAAEDLMELAAKKRAQIGEGEG